VLFVVVLELTDELGLIYISENNLFFLLI
jgi:hypothetical protein